MRKAVGPIAASRRRSAGGTPTVLGYSTKGASIVSGPDTGRMYVSSFTLASPGTLAELHGWVAGGNAVGGVNYKVVLYADSSGTPGSRLAFTSSYNAPQSTDLHLQETGFSTSLSAGTYWVGWISSSASSGGGCWGETTGSTHKGKTTGANFTTPDNPFPTPDTSGTRKHSCWAIVNV